MESKHQHRLLQKVDDVDNKEFLTGLFNSMYDELPAPKQKKKIVKLEVVEVSI